MSVRTFCNELIFQVRVSAVIQAHILLVHESSSRRFKAEYLFMWGCDSKLWISLLCDPKGNARLRP